MPRARKFVALALALALPLAVSAVSLAGAEEEQDYSGLPPNVLITVTVGETGPDSSGSEKSYELLALSGQETELLTGWRYPIPTSTFNTSSKGGKVTPVTSFSYQNLGMTVMLETRVVGESRIRIHGAIEVSGVDRELESGDAPREVPKLGTFNHRFNAILKDGVTAMISKVPHPGGGSIVVKLRADIDA
jgi:hypothetical protein